MAAQGLSIVLECGAPTIMAMEGPATSGQPQFSQLLYQPCPQVRQKGLWHSLIGSKAALGPRC